MTWFDPTQRWCLIDTESTGKDPTEARLVTACVAIVGGRSEPEIRSWVADAGVEVPDEAAAVHGYDTARVRAEGKPVDAVVPEIVDYLAAAGAANQPFVIFNAPYDTTLIDREMRRANCGDWATAFGGGVVFDPLCIDRKVDRYRPGKRTLEAACATYRVNLDGAHNAEFDARAAGRVLYRIGQRCQMTPGQIRAEYAERRYPNEFVKAFAALGAMSARDLHDAQRIWYRDQAEGLAAYWRREAAEKLAEADKAVEEYGPADEGAATVRAEAEELLARADGVSTEWPLRAVAS